MRVKVGNVTSEDREQIEFDTDGSVQVAFTDSPAGNATVSVSAIAALSGGGPLGAVALGQPTFDKAHGDVLLLSDTMHNAFPGLCVTPKRRHMVVFRRATSHTPSVGVICRAYLNLGTSIYMVNAVGAGSVASPGFDTIINDGTLDCRDPNVSTLSDGRIALSFPKTMVSGGLELLQNAYVCFSSDDGATWTTPTAVTTNFTKWAACTSPVIEHNGALYLPIFGSSAVTQPAVGDLATFVKSTDGGVTWTQGATILDGTSGGLNLEITEVTMTNAPNGDLLAAVRVDGANEIQFFRSTDHGATWANANATDSQQSHIAGLSSPRMLTDDTGLVVSVIRDPVTLMPGIFWSPDNGNSWPGPLLFDDNTHLGKVYSQYDYSGMALTAPGVICVVYAMELDVNHSDLRVKFIHTRPGVSPTGTFVPAVTLASPAAATQTPAASPALWLDAASLSALADNTAVATWPDKSGNSNDATASGSAQPTYLKAAYAQNVPGVKFDGVANALKVAANFAAADGIATVFVVGKRRLTTGASNQYLLSERNTASGWVLYLTNSGTLTFSHISAAAAKNTSITTVSAHRGSYDGTNLRTAVSGAQTALVASGFTVYTGPTELFIGAVDNNDDGVADNNFLDGTILEILIYTRVLSRVETYQTEAYLTNRYGITLL